MEYYDSSDVTEVGGDFVVSLMIGLFSLVVVIVLVFLLVKLFGAKK